MKKELLLALSLFPFALPASGEEAAVDLEAGKTLYEQMCYICHAAGIDGAPRLGSTEDWKPRLKMGLDTLYQSVIDGPNHMYSKGNSPIESKGEIRSMIAYMMESAIDDETRPLINSASEAEKARHLRLNNGYKNYDLVCFNCHDNGEEGAPRIYQPGDWKGRRQIGIDALTKSVIHGKGHMYMRALTANLSTGEYHNMVEYMLSTLE